MHLKNFLDVRGLTSLDEEEFQETLLKGKGFEMERIVSRGQVTPKGEWLESSKDEWVLLLQGEAEIMYSDMSVDLLLSGDYVLIPSGRAHKVMRTSVKPECVWLTIYH